MITSPPEMVLEVEQFPFNDDLRMDLTDLLIERNNPRGSLILEQCHPEPDQDLIQRLLTEHGRRWAAEDLGVPENQIPPGASVEFHKGFAWFPVQTTYPNFQSAVSAGKYDYVNPTIAAANFCLEDAEVVINEKLVLYSPGRAITSPAAVRELRRNLHLQVNCDQVWDLCAFGEKYPDVQRALLVAALGSVDVNLDGDRNVPCLDLWHARRELDLDYWDVEWDPRDRFLAARR